MLIAEPYGNLYDVEGRLVIEYSGEIIPVIETYGDIYVTPYGFFKGLFKSVGRIFHGAGKAIGAVTHAVVKGTGRIIHYTGKFLGKVAPIAVPLLVGVGISAVAGSIFGASAATASATTVAKAALAGNIGAALGGAAIYATKVVATQIISAQILKALYKKPHGEVVIAKGNKPAVIIPAFVRELVEPHHLVNFATQGGKLQNSKQIQSRVDWLSQKIKQTAQRIVEVYRKYAIPLNENILIDHLKKIFWDIPSSKREVEAKISNYIRNLSRNLCHQAVQNLYAQVRAQAPQFAAEHPISEYLRYCPTRSTKWIKEKIQADINLWVKEQERKREAILRQQAQASLAPHPPFTSTPQTHTIKKATVKEAGMFGGIKQEYLILGGILLVALFAGRRGRYERRYY